MKATILPCRRWIVGVVLGAVLWGCVGCNPTPPATKLPNSKPSEGERETLPTPKRDPG